MTMKTTTTTTSPPTTPPPASGFTSRVTNRFSRSAVAIALVAATARLGVLLAVAAGLLLILLNEIAEALVYVIAGLLALFMSQCACLVLVPTEAQSSAHTAPASQLRSRSPSHSRSPVIAPSRSPKSAAGSADVERHHP